MNTLYLAAGAAAIAVLAAGSGAAQMRGAAPMTAAPMPAQPLPGSMQSTPPVPTKPSTTATTPPSATTGTNTTATTPQSATKGATATTGTSSNTSASASGIAVGAVVKDNTGAAIGPITALTTGASGMATIKLGEQSFQVPASNLYMKGGSATINLSKAQLQAQLPKPPA
ncbi:MAG: hypothetical protein ACREEB_16125 [Caulobacteraceae bacterium]